MRNGKLIERIETTLPPTLKLSNAQRGPYVAICVDLDGPFPTLPFLSPILHWIQPDMQPTSDHTLESQNSCLVDWAAANPPPYSGPHRYLFILYKQPADLESADWEFLFKKPVGVWPRVRWNLDDFAKKAGLCEMVAAEWFLSY